MEYQNLINDFARRTRANLVPMRHLQTSHPELEIYEVTQLINSMVGLLVFPKERYIRQIPLIPLVELESQGWSIPNVVGDYPQVKYLNELVSYLRNGIAHCNLEFISDDGKQLRRLKIWNINPRTRQTT